MELATKAALLALASLVGPAAAGCTVSACWECATLEDCFNAPKSGRYECGVSVQGAWDPRTYDSNMCSLREQARVVPFEDVGPVEVDCGSTAIFGAIGGIFALFLPCCCMCTRRSRQHARWMLSAPDTAVTRVVAQVVGHHADSGRNQRGRVTTTHYVQVHFAAVRSSGATFNVSGQKLVWEQTYHAAVAAGQLQVAYPIDDERSFEVVSDLDNATGCTQTTVFLTGFSAACAGIGLALVALMGPDQGCYQGFIPFAVLMFTGALAGHFCIWPLMVRAKAAAWPITVLPVNAAAASVLGSPA